MTKDKERSVNPAQQQRKLEKARALKKSKTELQTRRNEKLARRNPDRIQRQIDDLKALETAGDIKPREKAILEELERDLKSVRKAREALGEKAPQYGNKQQQPQPHGRSRDGENNTTSVLGKRRYDGERKAHVHHHETSGSDTDDSVRRIPMPEDTPPPVPREYRRNYTHNSQNPADQVSKPAVETRTTYESAPQLRDLKKEAVNRFVPNVVRRKQDAVRGVAGQLMEPEELDRLEAAGYMNKDRDDGGQKRGNASEGSEAEEARRLAEEELRFQRELDMAGTDEGDRDRQMDVDDNHKQPQVEALRARPNRYVQVEEVEDEDA